jgi:hypothetical protein
MHCGGLSESLSRVPQAARRGLRGERPTGEGRRWATPAGLVRGATIVGLVLALAGCGSSGSSGTTAAESTSPTGDQTTGNPGSSASVEVGGAASGTFDEVNDCSTTRGYGAGMIISMGGTLGGSPATLTFDQDTFTPGTYTYPADTVPAVGTELRSDIVYDNNVTKGSWQLFTINPPSLVGDAGGTVAVTESGGSLDVKVDAKYGTTDASGPLVLEGEITCPEVP